MGRPSKNKQPITSNATTTDEKEVVAHEEVKAEKVLNGLTGYHVEDAFSLAGINEGGFPFKLMLDNKTSAMLAFPELQEQEANTLKAFARDITVVFLNQDMLHRFFGNLNNLAALFKWTDTFGVIIKGHKDGTN